MDSIFLAHKIVQSLKYTNTPGMIIKLSFSKAFDKLSGQNMEAMMKACGFCEEWITWIMNLASSTFFSIVLNGSPTNTFSPSQGIRQGDPLSPFMFILMAKGLSRRIKAAIVDGSLLGLAIHGLHLPATHNQFVDDVMFMGVATIKESSTFNQILDDFHQASGTTVNKNKSQLFFFYTPVVVQ